MAFDFFRPIVLDACAGSPKAFATEGPAAEPSIEPQPSVAFRPFVAEPVSIARSGQGEVLLVLGAGRFERRAADAALACLLRSQAVDRRSLLVELQTSPSPAKRPAQVLEDASRVAGSAVWRIRIAGSDWLRRDWLLFLDDCRSVYNTTALVAADHGAAHAGPVGLADRVVIATDGDYQSVTHAWRMLRQLRGSGALRSECLWLEAA